MTTYCRPCTTLRAVADPGKPRRIDEAPLAAVLTARLACGHAKTLVTSLRQYDQAVAT